MLLIQTRLRNAIFPDFILKIEKANKMDLAKATIQRITKLEKKTEGIESLIIRLTKLEIKISDHIIKQAYHNEANIIENEPPL